jgi:hypothetical protein
LISATRIAPFSRIAAIRAIRDGAADAGDREYDGSMAPRVSLLPRDSTFFDLFIEAGASSVHGAGLLDKLIER